MMRRRAGRPTAAAVLLATLAAVPPLARHAGAATPRTTLLVSDLHLGVGATAPGTWHAYEDFRWSADFAAFLERADGCGQGRTDLVVNGDAFELWQSPVVDECEVRADRNLGCSESEARLRLERVVAAHHDDLANLGRFARSGENAVVLVPGNHDAALLFPSVGRLAIEALAAPGRVRLAGEGHWLSSDGSVYAEHGHQIGRDVNKFSSWPRPFREHRGAARLERSWGEQFVQQFYNRYEERYPAIDNFLGETTGVRYGLAAERLGGALLGSARFLRFALFDVSRHQFLGSLGGRDAEAPRWSVDAVRQESGDRFLIESLPPSDPLRAEAERAWEAGIVAMRLSDLGDQEILEICDLRQTIRQEDHAAGRPPSVAACPATLGAATTLLPGVQARLLRQHLEEVRQAMAADRPFRVFVYSHTHDARPPAPQTGGLWRPLVANTGAWQRLVTAAGLEALRAEHGWSERQVLESIDLERLPACYPFVVVPPHAGDPQPRLAHWRRSPGGQWEVSDTCLATTPARRCPVPGD